MTDTRTAQATLYQSMRQTNPGEDIAETVAHFVIEGKPRGNTTADEKVRSLYDYPELVELREQIRENLEIE